MRKLTITRPDDLHIHLRDGNMLKSVVNHTASQYQRATVMPNLRPPILNLEDVLSYRDRIRDALPRGSEFEPIIPLYLTNSTTPQMVIDAYDSGISKAMKLYPAGATTNSDDGITDFTSIESVIKVMIDRAIPLLIHGEVADPSIDMFDRERLFIEQILIPLRDKFPELKVVMEHISTKDAAQYVAESSETMAASITPHHIHLNRSALFSGGLQPHNYCLPVLKTEDDRVAVLEAATSGSPKFFLGTDSAPHLKTNKERAGGAAGLYNGYNSLALYAQAFEEVDALDKLEGFASFYGADFYGLERNSDTITLIKETNSVPNSFKIAIEGEVVPLFAGREVSWRVDT